MAGGDHLLPLPLEICEDFFAGADPTTRGQVETVLRALTALRAALAG